MNETIKACIRDSNRFFSNRDLTEQEQYNNLIFILESCGLEYDIQAYGIVLKYPDTPCVDTNGNSVLIRDLYINLSWTNSLSFRRFTFTELEYNMGYTHSHLSGGIRSWITSFCFGDRVTFNTSPFIDIKLVTLIGLLPLFIRTESSNNAPFHRLNKLCLLYNEIQSTYSLSLDSTYDKLFRNNLKVKIVKDKFFNIRVEIPDELLNQYCVEKKDLHYYHEGKWYKSKAKSTLSEPKVEITNFVFKDQPIPLTILPSEDIDITPQACGQTKKNIRSYYEYQFKTRSSFWESFITILDRNGALRPNNSN